MSNYTHKLANDAIYKERSETMRHHKDYFDHTVAKLRELKMRQALGEVSIHRGGGYMQKLTEAIAQETRQLLYARDCVRRARRSLWQFMALRRTMRFRVEQDT